MLSRFPLIDGHNDLPWAIREQYASAGQSGLEAALDAAAVDKHAPGFHTDIPRLVEGGVGGQFWSVYVPGTLEADEAVRVTLDQVDLVRRLIRKYPSRFSLALTADDAERAFQAGRIASLLGAEGGHSIGGSLGVLRSLHALGVRYMTLTHNQNVGWADSATDVPDAGGLTDFGRDVVAEMQRLGMLVDLSHVAVCTMNDVLDVAGAPVIFSHSSAKAVTDSPRNVPDDVLRRLAANGGVCMVAFVPAFVSQDCADWLAGLKKEAERRGIDPRDLAGVFAIMDEHQAGNPLPQATLSQVADHIEHVRDIAGIEHVGIGGDFDGTPDLPAGLGDVSRYPALFRELVRRGWSEPDCKALAGGNILRVLREAESFAQLSRNRGSQSPLGLSQTPVHSRAMTASTEINRPPNTPAAPAAPPTTVRNVAGLELLAWAAFADLTADAFVTARPGGVSAGPYESLNLGLSVGDDPAAVVENRRRVAAAIGADLGDFVFTRQVHGAGVRVVTRADRATGAFALDESVPDGDVLVTADPSVVLAILTADCVPVVLLDSAAGVLACVHAGWRGTVARACAAAVTAMAGLGAAPDRIVAGIGPAIAAGRYQVGDEVAAAARAAFGPNAAGEPGTAAEPGAAGEAAGTVVRPDGTGRWLFDLPAANRLVLRQAGLADSNIHTSQFVTGPAPAAAIAGSPGDAAPRGRDGMAQHAMGTGTFFSDRSARPCGRLALVARLRPNSGGISR